MAWQLTFTNGRWQRVFVAPRGVLLPVFDFDVQRAVCQACAHHLPDISAGGVAELLCTVHGLKRTACSLMRAAGESCGPSAVHFQPKRALPRSHYDRTPHG